MDGVTVRGARQEDASDICRIWGVCFGDAPETVEALLEPETLENTTVAATDGHVRALMAAFDGLDFGGVRASYIFALCTEPGWRGRGLGERVLRETARRCFERGADLACLHPASESLARWYARLGLETLSRVSFEAARFDENAAPGLRRVSAGEYAALRAGAEPGVPEALLRAQELFYSGEDGGLFAFDGGFICVQGAEVRELPGRGAVRLPAGAQTHLCGLWKNGARREFTTPPYLPFLLD